jgi:hypothetical protein
MAFIGKMLLSGGLGHTIDLYAQVSVNGLRRGLTCL